VNQINSVCEGSPLTIKCPLNQIITITSAIWGRSSLNTCGQSSNKISTLNVTKKIATMCNSKNSCVYTPTSSLLGVSFKIK
jgi:hypothetical protein